MLEGEEGRLDCRASQADKFLSKGVMWFIACFTLIPDCYLGERSGDVAWAGAGEVVGLTLKGDLRGFLTY